MAEPIQLTLVLRSPASSAAIGKQLLAGTYDPGSLNPSDISANTADVQAVTNFAASHNLQVLKTDPAARTVRVAGSAADIEQAFGIRSGNPEEGSVQSLNYKGPVDLPAPLNGIVIAVLGLDHTPIARPHAGSQ